MTMTVQIITAELKVFRFGAARVRAKIFRFDLVVHRTSRESWGISDSEGHYLHRQ